jgi:GT2 family glycosyltransferase
MEYNHGTERVPKVNIAILVPTFFRPLGLRRLLQSLKDTAPAVHPVVAVEPDDAQAHGIAREFGATLVTCPPRMGSVCAWNLALAAEPNYDAYILGADDCYYLPGWYEAMLQAIEANGGSGLFALNDNTSCNHYLMTRDFILEHHGGVMAIPHYSGWFLDYESCDRAERVGKRFFAESAKIVHDWHGSATKINSKRDEEIYKTRKAAGFPDDFKPIVEMEWPQ